MTEPGRERTPFGQLDQLPPEIQTLLLGALTTMAESPQIRAVRDVAEKALAPRAGQRLLDAGCGVGEVARGLAAAVAPGGEVVAVDASTTTVTAAAERHDGSAVRYETADILALPYPDGAFDGVRSERVLQHVRDPDAAIAELARVTKPGGRVCLIDTDWDSIAADGLPADLVDAVATALRARDLLHHRDMGRTLRRRLVRAGLEDVRAEAVPLVFTRDAEPGPVLPMFDPKVPPAAGLVPPEVRDEWFAAIEDALRRNELLVVLTQWVAVGTPHG
jgi:SAM-dependent methyltransferase